MPSDSIPRYFSGKKFLLYVPLAALISIVPSALVAFSAVQIAIWLDGNFIASQPVRPASTPFFIFFATLPGPLIETWVVIWIIRVTRRFFQSPVSIAAVTAIICGIAHELAETLWFFGTVWSFFVFSYGFIIWRPHSFRYALLAAFLPHALQNFLVHVSMLIWP